MAITVNIRGLAELERKLHYSVLADAAITEGMETIGERLDRSSRARTSKGRKLVVHPKNTMSRRTSGLSLTYTSSLRGGRRTGAAWVKKHIGGGEYGKGIVGSMVPFVFRKAAQRIEARFGE